MDLSVVDRLMAVDIVDLVVVVNTPILHQSQQEQL